MDRARVVERYKELLNQLGEPAQNVVLSAGAALVILGLREKTTNLNVDVPTGVFLWAFNNTNAQLKASGQTLQTIRVENGVPLFNLSDDVSLQELSDTTGLVCVEGVWMYSPFELLQQKRYLAKLPNRDQDKRERDLKEVGLIEELRRGQKLTARVMA